MPYSVRGLYDKKYCFSSDVMYKKYKRLVYTPSDLLARICKVNLSNAKKCGLICFPRICFRGLIYCDQEPLWLLNVIEDVCYFLGVHIFKLSTRCKMFHSKITYPFPQKSHECALKLRWLPRVFTNNPSYLAYVTERNLVTLSLRFCSRDSPLRLPI